ncbi:MAG: hypothetical protein KDA84_25040 [Planctomycetaceae bacterium]|nr:hypothetical protein [Planctomycetaceae bacterium]
MFSALPTIVTLPSLAIASWGFDWIPTGTFAGTVEISNSINRWFRRSNSLSENSLWIFIFIAILVLWALLYFWDRHRKPGQRTKHDREGLFLQLCDLHNLSRGDRQFLRKVAKSQNLDQPSVAFVDPRVLMRHIDQFPQSEAETRKLLDRLFGKSLIAEIVEASATSTAATPV